MQHFLCKIIECGCPRVPFVWHFRILSSGPFLERAFECLFANVGFNVGSLVVPKVALGLIWEATEVLCNKNGTEFNMFGAEA